MCYNRKDLNNIFNDVIEHLKKDNPLVLNELLSDIVMKDIAIRFGIKNTRILI